MSETSAAIVPAQPAPLSAAVAEYIPLEHHNEWLGLKIGEQERVKELLNVFDAVRKDTRGVVKALRIVSLENTSRDGWSYGNLKTLYYAWVEAGFDWRVLARGYSNEQKLRPELVEWLRTAALREHRSKRQAIFKLYALWREGKPVAGYGTWREWYATTYPERDVPKTFPGITPPGWKPSNLYRYFPSKVQHTLATKGRTAISGMIPKLQRDPSELRFLELITIDDFETDVLVKVGRDVVPVRGLLAIDVATRTHLAVGFKPRLRKEDGKRMSITHEDMQTLLPGLFAWGVPANYPMTILVENAAAAISSELEAALDLHFGGQVRIERTGMLNYKTIANGFVERSGKPQEKGWIESFFNAWWNVLGSLPGQKGSRYDNAPGDLEAKVKYFKQIAAYECSDERFAQFRVPFMSFDEAVTAFTAGLQMLEQRTQHKMLGFEEVTEWRLPGEALQPVEQLATLSPAQQLTVQFETRMQSPVERRAKLLAGAKFLRVPEPVLALLSFSAKRVTVKNHKVTFTIRGQGYTFAQAGSDIGRTQNGKEIVAYYDERTMAAIYCFGLEGNYLGTLAQLGGAAGIKDTEALSAAAERIREFVSEEIERPTRHLMAADRAQADADKAHNHQLAVRLGLKNADDDQDKPKGLSRTLAQDNYVEPKEGRFAAALQSAAGIAAGATEQADNARRAKVRRSTSKDLSALSDAPADTPATARPERDLSALL
ncbi:MAG: hypothetical protein KF715_08505 [Candidatus Didemnitutus sp.]|nr:hypothetical protein [Candidatus Didemnitutus sp.]